MEISCLDVVDLLEIFSLALLALPPRAEMSAWR